MCPNTGVGARPVSNLWEGIWKSNTMPKVKTFAWKLVSNAVAVRVSLARRGILVQTGCPMCSESETIEHLLWECSWVQRAWHELLGLYYARDGCQDVKEWMQKRHVELRIERTMHETR